MFVNVNTGERTSYIGTIYKPESADCNVFIDSIQNILSTINQSKIYDLMLCGDFNIDLLYKDCNNLTSFLNTMYSLSLLPIISKPTRITNNSATLIDKFFINEPCNFESGILISDILDHFPIFFNRKNFFCTNSSKNENKGVHYRINQNTLSALDEMLALTNFDAISNNDNINEAKQLLFDIINNAFTLCCPIRTRTLSHKNTTKPWISGEISANIKKRRNYHSLVRQNKMSHQLYLRFRNFVTNQIMKAKRNYFAHKFQKFKGDCKNTRISK